MSGKCSAPACVFTKNALIICCPLLRRNRKQDSYPPGLCGTAAVSDADPFLNWEALCRCNTSIFIKVLGAVYITPMLLPWRPFFTRTADDSLDTERQHEIAVNPGIGMKIECKE